MMSASTSDTIDSIGRQVERGDQKRLHIREEIREGMEGAARVAIIALGVAAQATHNVPYLGAISTALTEFMKIQDEVEECKAQCTAVMGDAQDMKVLIERFRGKCIESGKGDGVLEGSLRIAFVELEKVVLECILTLDQCKMKSKRTGDRIRLFLKRSELTKSVKSCADKMRAALKHFNTTLQVDQVILLEDLRLAVRELKEVQTPGSPPAASYVPSAWRMRSAPQIFYGREGEVSHAVDLIVRTTPARVAVLGPCGVGKTSIALSVLHNPQVKALYGDRRCFISCEATFTAADIIRLLVEALRLHIPSTISTESARHDQLFAYLTSVSGLICLDNFETPWNTDTAAVESLLAEMTSLPSIGLIITSRVSDTPLIRWSSPPLDHITTFSIEAALQTWNTICDRHDEYAIKLIQAVDRLPLAVTLLARLARTETTKIIWARWQTERTALMRSHGVAHHLDDLSVSIELSLQSLVSQEAVDVLSIISIFPDGLSDFSRAAYSMASDVARFESAFKSRLSVRRAIALLKQLSLVYTEASKHDPEILYTHVLSPIRYHMLHRHRVSDELFMSLADIVYHTYMSRNFQAYLKEGMTRIGPCRDLCLRLVASKPDTTRDVELLSQALDISNTLDLHQLSSTHQRLGTALTACGRYEEARSSIHKSIRLDDKSGDRRALFEDWTTWLNTFRREFAGREDQCTYLDQVQGAIQTAWGLGCDENQGWDRGFYGGYWDLSMAQHSVNEGRRKLDQPVLQRSGLYSSNDSAVELRVFKEVKASYDQLTEMSPPPWDLSLIMKTIETPNAE